MNEAKNVMMGCMVLCVVAFIGGLGVSVYSIMELIGTGGEGSLLWGMLGFGTFVAVDAMFLIRGVQLAYRRIK